MNYNTEEYEYLQNIEEHLGHSINEGYCRLVNRKMLGELAKIYKRVMGRESKILNGCNRCILEDIKTIARMYFSDKKEMEAQNKAIEKTVEEIHIDTPKKATRKKTATKTTNKKKK